MIKTLTLFFILIHCSIAYGQQNLNSAKNNALAGNGVSFSRGIETLHINPANLSFFDRKTWEISFLPILAIDFQNNVFNYETYKKYFTGDGNGNPKYLSALDKNDILSQFDGTNPGRVISSTSFDILNIAINYKEISGGFGFSIRERIFSQMNIAKDAFKLLLFGNTLNEKYNFSDFKGSGYWVREYGIGYGFQFIKSGKARAAFGINLKYLTGQAMFSMNDTEADFITTDTSLNGRIKLRALYSYSDFFKEGNNYKVFENSGQGQSFDVGFSYIPNELVSLGISLIDFGYMIWKKNLFEINLDTSGIIKNISDENEYKPFEDLIENHKSQISKKKINLPYTLHAGITINLDKSEYFQDINSFPIALCFEYSSTVNTEYFLSESINQYGISLSLLPVKWLPLRAGYSFGYMPSRLTIGTGLNFTNFDIDISFGNISALFLANSAKSFSFSFSSKILF